MSHKSIAPGPILDFVVDTRPRQEFPYLGVEVNMNNYVSAASQGIMMTSNVHKYMFI